MTERQPDRPSATRGELWLLWTTGLVALVLGAVAFVLWGTRAGDFIFDLVAAYCA
jgi:hypothetical protein